MNWSAGLRFTRSSSASTCSVSRSLRTGMAVDAQRAAEVIAHVMYRIQRREGVLEDHTGRGDDRPAVPCGCRPLTGCASEAGCLPARRFIEPRQHARDSRLAAAALADQRQRPARARASSDMSSTACTASWSPPSRKLLHGEVLAQVCGLEYRRGCDRSQQHCRRHVSRSIHLHRYSFARSFHWPRRSAYAAW